MTRLYVIDNHGEYSDHWVALVEADPDYWGEGLEDLLLLRHKKYNQRAEIVLVADQWRPCVADCTSSVAEHVSPDIFWVNSTHYDNGQRTVVQTPYSHTDRGHTTYYALNMEPSLVRRPHLEKLIDDWAKMDAPYVALFCGLLRQALESEKWLP